MAPSVLLPWAGVGQCLSVADDGVALSAAGRVRAVMETIPTADCSGAPSSSFNSPPANATGNWQTAAFDGVTVPAGTASVLAGFGFGARGLTPVDANVDAGYAGERPLVFRDGLEGDRGSAPPACRWSSVVP